MIGTMSRIADLSGRRFGKLTVVAFCERNRHGQASWTCLCDCGRSATILGNHLKSGATVSCGCSRRKDVTGRRFGRLVVQQPANSLAGSARWQCLCDCGRVVIVAGSSLVRGRTTTCGCRKSWGGIPGRWWCNVRGNAESRNIKFEITIQQAWTLFTEQKCKCALTGRLLSFEDKTASLDRIDSTKPYVLRNVQWVHKQVNLMKRELSQSDFVQVCRDVVRHHFPLE